MAVDDLLLSTFRPTLSQNMFLLEPGELGELPLPQGSYLTVLNGGETLSVIGTLSLMLLQGSITLDGTTLRPSRSAHRVFAPSSHPVPCIAALHKQVAPCVPLPTRLSKHVHPRDVVLVLSEVHTDVEGLTDVCRAFEDVFAPEEDFCTPMPLRGLYLIERATRRAQPFDLPPSWQTALDAVEAPPAKGRQDNGLAKPLVIMVKGAKRSGKSTLARTALNRLVMRYRRVAFLECDVGQSEFTPAGIVALNIVDRPQFGPSFTHLSTPLVAHFTGSTSPRANPSHYLSCVSACLQTYSMDVQHTFMDDDNANEADGRISDIVPLVINTHGWNKGLGADLTRKIQDMIPVTDIIDFDEPTEHDSASRVHYVAPVVSSLTTLYNAADLRALSIISYFHMASATSWNCALPLCALPPWEVSWRDAVDSVVLGCPGGEDVPADEVHTAINGGIVALVSADPGTIDLPARGANGLPYSQGATFPSPTSSRCIGLALVRYAAADAPHMHIVTPVHPSLLGQARVLVKGEVELPVWAWLDHRAEDGRVAGVPKDKVPYLQWGVGGGKGATRRKVRRNLMRWGQA
ncbi:hypothetical protein AURDEDRAFT_81640 [Auricularia subglabra TFB-10046 SS5]|nr:hypothetical protein AURDEDRAFT_81640 [Auricularia subglabra TFB-10046 SS5]